MTGRTDSRRHDGRTLGRFPGSLRDYTAGVIDRSAASSLRAPLVVLCLATTASATYPGGNGQLAYARYGGKDVPSTLRTLRPDGSPGRTLARPLLGLPDAEWSPDGTHVAMVVGKEPNRIVILDVHTDERSVVIRSEDVSDSRFIDSLGMSPDGQTLVFCSVDTTARRCTRSVLTARP